jgi:hypothetical protein
MEVGESTQPNNNADAHMFGFYPLVVKDSHTLW